MMKDNFEKAFQKILKFEGGYSDSTADRGGKTKFGITERVARANGYRGDMKGLPLDTAKMIYYNNYWDYEYIDNEKIAIECFEQAVNMGVATANRHLQRAYNLLSDDVIAEDGIVGPKTIQAINNCPYQDDLYKLLNILQAMRYIRICEADESQKKFIRGWMKRIELK